MTWNTLAKKILCMTPEQQGTDVSILMDNEIYPALQFVSEEWNDSNPAPCMDDVSRVLDDGHPFLIV